MQTAKFSYSHLKDIHKVAIHVQPVKIPNDVFLLSSLQGPKSEDDVADGAEAAADEADELSGYEPESDVNTMTVLSHFTCSFLCPVLYRDSELLNLIVQ